MKTTIWNKMRRVKIEHVKIGLHAFLILSFRIQLYQKLKNDKIDDISL